MKKVLSIILTLALLVTIAPWYPSAKVSANSTFFSFSNESTHKDSARVVTTQNVTLTGTLNNVSGQGIRYTVIQVPATGEDGPGLTKSEETDLNISVVGNRITVSDISLFPGMNKIVFKGSNGMGEVEGIIYIEFRNSPMLTNLVVQYNNGSSSSGGTHRPEEDGLVMLYRPTDSSRPDTITVTGNAPNASNVQIELNGDMYPYTVSPNNDYIFRFTDLRLNPGVNTIKFKISSANQQQEFETTRSVVLYNQTPVYYEEQLQFVGATNGLQSYNYNGEYIVDTSATALNYKAKLIIPNPFPVSSTETIVQSNAMGTYLENNLKLVTGGNRHDITAAFDAVSTGVGTDYFVFDVSGPLLTTLDASNKGSTVQFRLELDWAPGTASTATKQVRLIDGSSMYIADVNYLSGYNSSMVNQKTIGTGVDAYGVVETNNINQFLQMQSVDISNKAANVTSVPFMVEVLIGQYPDGGLSPEELTKAIKIESRGTALNKKVLVDNNNLVVSQDVTLPVNGNRVSYKRVFIEVSNLRVAGSNVIDFQLSNIPGYNQEVHRYTFNLMTGPYVRFDNVADGMTIDYHARKDNINVILEAVNNLKGNIFNVNNTDEIVYSHSSDDISVEPAANQSVYLHINNVEIPLKATGNSKSSFEIAGLGTEHDEKVKSLLKVINLGGENSIKFTFFSKSYNFTSNYKFTVMPKDLPKIPAENGEGVFPYADVVQWPPVFNNNDYQKTGTSYTTRKGNANVIGTFDILSLQSQDFNSNGNLYAEVNRELQSLFSSTDNTNDTSINPNNFKVTISSPDWGNQVFEWNPSNKFYVSNDKMEILNSSGVVSENPFDEANVVNQSGKWSEKSAPPGVGVRMIYNAQKHYFYFNITNEMMPEDNSPLVYVITVYNAGDSGPRASYRLEINPISIPYTLHSPIPENRILNSDFVEVIISSPGASSVTVNKQEAEKVKLINHNDPRGATYIDAFRVVVKNLKANKETNIPFTITRSGTTTTDSVAVKYVPTTIPGAQSLQTMKASHKVFDGALTLTFPKNTNLIRTNYNDVEVTDHATQVFNAHDLLFSIANAHDGVVNRHLFETAPANYDPKTAGKSILTDEFLGFAGRYIKASNVFWIDSGLADDPNTTSYDPITTGLDPFPYPRFAGLQELGVTNRQRLGDREIVPSKPGSLTLKYDSSIVASASTTVTVFHYNAILKNWENIGGVVDAKKGTITVPFNQFGYYVVAKLTRSYNDIIGHSYAREAMEAVYAKGIMNAFSSAVQFGGDQYVTRGEFARMIVKALDIPLNYAGPLHFSYYQDTMSYGPLALYDYRYIETAARAGIVNGRAPGFFDEGSNLTREEAAVILARALELKLDTDSNKAKQQLAKAFQDSGSFDFYSIPGVLAIQKKKFIVGIQIDPANPKSGYVFQPKARLLRSDAAIIISRVMTDQKKLPAIYN